MPQNIHASVEAHGPVSTKIAEAENKQGWKKRKLASAESTGLGIDHHAADCKDPVLNEIDALFRQLHGFSPEAWRVITDVEMLKKAGVFDVESMRTTQQMHSEFDMNDKMLGQDVMAFAKLHKALAEEQFGGQKNHQSVLEAPNKRLTVDLLRRRRQAGALSAPTMQSPATTALCTTLQCLPFIA
jgi:hypothetical protein